MTRRRVAALMLVAAATTAACAPSSTASTGDPAATVIVTSVRTGSPVPQWDDVLARQFTSDLDRRAAWIVVVADGRPSALPPAALTVDGGNALIRDHARSALQGELTRRLAAASADDPEVDLLASLDLAGRALAGRPGPRTVVVRDSGLSTAGALRFQDRGGALLGADPAAVAARLADDGALPDLRGVDVVWAGLGDVAAPQDPLPIAARGALVDLWRAVLVRAGARVTVVPAPMSGDAVTGRPPVSVVPVAAPRPVSGPVALPDGLLGFLPDLAVLRDPGRAAAVVAPWAERLREGGQRVLVTGTTSSAGDDEAGRLTLSRQRAAATARLLQDAGVPAGLIEVRGVGVHFPGFVPDRDANGRLDPVLAAANRSVVLELVPLP